MPPSTVDPSRLYQILNNTGLQNKDNPLYQLLLYLIGQILKLTNSVAALTSGGSSSTTTVVNNTTIMNMGDSGDSADATFISVGGGSSSGSGVTLAQVTAAVSLRL